MILPSKELLEAVLGCMEVIEVTYNELSNTIEYATIEEYLESKPHKIGDVECTFRNTVVWRRINIYELQHRKKEWIISKGYDVLSGGLEAGLYSCYIDYADKRYTIQMTPLYHTFEETEFEAVTKACEWMLKELNKI